MVAPSQQHHLLAAQHHDVRSTTRAIVPRTFVWREAILTTRNHEDEDDVDTRMNSTPQLLGHNDDDSSRQQKQQQSRRESLMFSIHFVGDIHQPLHCARQTDRGGNSFHVRYDAVSSSMNTSRDTTASVKVDNNCDVWIFGLQ
jgi:S1/P1 Nuclease